MKRGLSGIRHPLEFSLLIKKNPNDLIPRFAYFSVVSTAVLRNTVEPHSNGPIFNGIPLIPRVQTQSGKSKKLTILNATSQ